MKNIIIYGLLFFLLGTTTLVVALSQNLKDKIIRSFATADVDALAKCFGPEVALELFDREEYEGEVAIKERMQTFFDQYPPKAFRIKHEGGEKHKNYSFLIGVLQTKEEVFRVSLTIQDDLIESMSIVFEAPVN